MEQGVQPDTGGRMKLLSSFVLVLAIAAVSFGQVPVTVNTGPLQTGFAIVTPVSGTGEGFSVSETASQVVDGVLFQASLTADPLVTLTNVVVSADPTTGVNTGIAIANPNRTPATVTLDFRNPQGVTVASRTLVIGAVQQVARFVTDLFSGDPAFAQPVTGLLFISSDVPIGIVAVAINGSSFTVLPVSAQLTTNNVTTAATATTTVPATVTTTATTASNGVTITSITPPSIPVTPTFNGVTTPPTILPFPTITPITGTAAPLVTSTGVPATTTVTTPTSATTVTGFVFPQVAPNVGGPGGLLLPAVATGGGWTTKITIANSSTLTQTVRVDFFNPAGGPMSLPFGSTVSNIAVPPGGVVTLTL
jgi:hypothetical protein